MSNRPEPSDHVAGLRARLAAMARAEAPPAADVSPCRRLDHAVAGPLGLVHWCLGAEGHFGWHSCRCGWRIRPEARPGDHPPDERAARIELLGADAPQARLALGELAIPDAALGPDHD